MYMGVFCNIGYVLLISVSQDNRAHIHTHTGRIRILLENGTQKFDNSYGKTLRDLHKCNVQKPVIALTLTSRTKQVQLFSVQLLVFNFYYE